MKKIYLYSIPVWSTILLVAVIFTVFILPVLPESWHKSLFRISYTVIYVSAILSLEKRSKKLIIMFFSTLIIEWLSAIFNLEAIYYLSRTTNISFFLIIIILLIKQIATSREVTAGVIMSSVTGYLLLGLIYSIFVGVIMFKDPTAYSNIDSITREMNFSTPFYYSYVTLASLGYGDICPLKPHSRALATVIAVSGQFYMAIIVALLVGKFSTRSYSEE